MCEVTEVSKVEGEASINNRKGKLIFFYEWNLKATWTGKEKTGGTVNLVTAVCHAVASMAFSVSDSFTPVVSPGKSKTGVKYKGTVEVPNLSDENDMEDLDVSGLQ